MSGQRNLSRFSGHAGSIDDSSGVEDTHLPRATPLGRRAEVISLRKIEEHYWDNAPYHPNLAVVISQARAHCYNALPEHVRNACRRDPAGRGLSEYYHIQY